MEQKYMRGEEQQPINRAELHETRKARLFAGIGQLKIEILQTTQKYVRDAQTEILRGFKTADTATGTLRALEQPLMAIEERLWLNPPRPR